MAIYRCRGSRPAPAIIGGDGPGGDARYIIKRDVGGNMVRAVAEDPMPDFAFRNERWVCAPVVDDGRGNPAYNVAALRAGPLTDKTRERIVPDLWRRLGIVLYAGLAPSLPAERAFVFETEKGDLLSLDEASFEAAVKADLALRGA